MAKVAQPIELTPAQGDLLETTKRQASRLAQTLNECVEAEIPQAVLLPELVGIMRESGLLPAGFKIPFMRGL